MNQNENETIESSYKKFQIISVILIFLGCLFIYLINGKVDLNDSQLAARYLGYLLIFIGISTLIFNEKISISIDENNKTVKLNSKNMFGQKTRTLLFSEIEGVGMVRITRGANPIDFYLIHLKTKLGEKIRTGIMFVDELAVQEEINRIAQLIGCPSQPIVLASEKKISNFIIAFFISILSYIAYYRLTSGPLCSAMWFGSMPAIFIMAMTWVVYIILQRTRK